VVRGVWVLLGWSYTRLRRKEPSTLEKVWARWRKSGPDPVRNVSAGECSLIYCASGSGYVVSKGIIFAQTRGGVKKEVTTTDPIEKEQTKRKP